jgi:predicted Zn-dependent protease
MDAYTGKYYIQSGEEQEATVLILKDKLSIGLRDEHGNARVVYWHFDQVLRDNFWKRGQAIVRCGTYPVQTIEVDSKEFADKLERVLREREKPWLQRMLNNNMSGVLKVLAILVVILVSAYFWLIPFLADRLAKRVPVSYEEQLGDDMYSIIREGYTMDERKTAYINEFFRELKISSVYNIRITVVKEDLVNAFAMPGGNIIVFDKILMGMNGYEDLAALLSHEFTHVEEKHTTRSLFRQLGSTIFLSVLFGDIGGIGSVIVGNANNLKSLSYSRKLEKEADMNGLKILSDRKIDCNGFVDLFQFLEKQSAKEDLQPAEWISSHPDLSRRIEYIKSNELFNKNGVETNEALKTLFLKIKTEG